MSHQLTLSCDLDKSQTGPTLIHSTGVEHYKIPSEVIQTLQQNLSNDVLSDHEQGVLCQEAPQRILGILRQNGFTLQKETTDTNQALWTLVQSGVKSGSASAYTAVPLTLSYDSDKVQNGPTLIHSAGVEHYKIPPEAIQALQQNLSNDVLSDHEQGVLCQAGPQRVLDALQHIGYSLQNQTTQNNRGLWTLGQGGGSSGGSGGHQPAPAPAPAPIPVPVPQPTPSGDNDANADAEGGGEEGENNDEEGGDEEEEETEE